MTAKFPSFRKTRNSYFTLQVALFLRAVATKKISLRKIWNVFLNDLFFLLKIKEGPPSPFILSLELWNECNAGCLFCRDKKGGIRDLNPSGINTISKGKMPPEMAIEIMRQLKDDLLTVVLYTNGEPLLYPDLAKVIDYASSQRITSVIATNGLLFNADNARAILEAGIDLIKIQLSGFTQDVYSIQIRYGDVEKLKENIRLVAQMNQEGRYGTIILVDYILYDYNKHQLPLIRQFCKELGINLSVRPGNPAGGLENLEAPLVTEKLPLSISCDFLWKVMQVNFNGDILPCCEAVVWSGAPAYDTFKLGQTNIKAVWRGKAAQDMRTKMNTVGRKGTDMCAKCARKGICFKW